MRERTGSVSNRVHVRSYFLPKGGPTHTASFSPSAERRSRRERCGNFHPVPWQRESSECVPLVPSLNSPSSILHPPSFFFRTLTFASSWSGRCCCGLILQIVLCSSLRPATFPAFDISACELFIVGYRHYCRAYTKIVHRTLFVHDTVSFVYPPLNHATTSPLYEPRDLHDGLTVTEP